MKTWWNRALAVVLSVVMAVTLAPAPASALVSAGSAGLTGQALSVRAPRVVADWSMVSGQKAIWDCVWFGSYPQEVVSDAATIAALDKASWSGDRASVGGAVYARLNQDEMISSDDYAYYSYYFSDFSSYYGSNGCLYFKCSPIKWRVLETDGSTALLLADQALDGQRYNSAETSVTWETCTLRSWLNSSFEDAAFTPAEKAAIRRQTLANEDNHYYGTAGGNATSDDVFLLSNDDVAGSLALAHGFAADECYTSKTYGIRDGDVRSGEDGGRRAHVSDFANAMGGFRPTYDSFSGGLWWLRSPGLSAIYASFADDDGYVYYAGSQVHVLANVVRPALRISLSSNQISYAGTVCSDGTYDEVSAPSSGNYSRAPGITEDDLFGKYNSFLTNNTYLAMEGELRRDMSAILDARSGWDNFSSVLASNLKNGAGSNVLNAIMCSVTGRYYDQDELDRAIALAYLRELSKSQAGVWDDAVGALKGNLKTGKNLYGVISNGFKNASEKREFAKAMADGAGGFYGEKEALELIRNTETNWDSISKAFSTAGRVVNDAEVVYTVLAATQADHEMIQDLLGLLDPGTSLYNGLKELDRYQKHGIGSMASTMVKDKVFDEITGLMEDQGVGRLASLIAGTGGIETGGAVFIANLGWKVVAAGAHKLGVADTDELFTAMAHISNQYALDRALTGELIKISENYTRGGGIPVAQLKAEYALLYRCYLVSIQSAVGDVAAVSTRASLTKELQSDWSRYGRHLTYENYIASCLASARTQWLYKTSGGKATITGISGSGSARAALKASSRSDDAVPPVDIPAEVNGAPVTAIAPGAFSGVAGLSCISVPDSVATIGDSAFEGAAGLEAVFLGTGVREIGASSFAGCDALADIALPASLESIGEGAFSGNATTLRPQEGTVGASACEAYAEGAAEGSVSIDPLKKIVSGIEVKSLPAKTRYLASETADPEQPEGEVGSAADARASSVDSTGLVLTVTYEDGSTAEVDDGFYCEFAGKSAGESHVDVFYGGCATQYPIEITADSCAYAVSYVDQAGLKVADDATGQGTAGSAVELVAPEVEGYTPVERSKTVTVEPGGRYTVEYAKDALPSVDDAAVEIAPASYTGQSVQPEVTVRYGSETLVRDRDYYMEYGENVDAGAGLVLIGGMGAYGGVSLREFAISPIGISGAALGLSQAAYTYDGKAKKPTVTVKLGGATLKAGTDYTVSYSANVNAGTAKATVTGEGNYTGTASAEFSIGKAVNVVSMSTAVVVKTGNVSKAVTFTRAAKATSGAVKYASNSKYVTVSKAGKVTVRKNWAGTAKVTVGSPASANYKAAASKSYAVKVKPGKMAVKAVANVKGGKAKVTWVKMVGADKYQVRAALDAKFTKGKKTYSAAAKLASKTTGRLEKGKTYYVQVRAYDKQTNSWGAWSAAKKVKIGK